jgi:hypothetical protein
VIGGRSDGLATNPDPPGRNDAAYGAQAVPTFDPRSGRESAVLLAARAGLLA